MLVQLGDITDRGPDSLKIIRHLQQLQAEAPKAGGKVIVLLGNHEAMMVLGDTRYTMAGEYAAFAGPQSAARRTAWFEANRESIVASYRASDKRLGEEDIRKAWLAKTPLGWVEHAEAWKPGGELGRWAASNPAIAKVGPYLFVHGGISAETASRSLSSVNRDIARAVGKGEDGADSPLNDPLGPLWYRGLLGRDLDAEAARLDRPGSKGFTPAAEVANVLAAYGAKAMVVAHTPDKKGIGILYDGKLARIDTGISRYYGGVLSWLEINGETMIPHAVKRTAP